MNEFQIAGFILWGVISVLGLAGSVHHFLKLFVSMWFLNISISFNKPDKISYDLKGCDVAMFILFLSLINVILFTAKVWTMIR